MYFWIGCKLPEDFEQEIRSHCLALNQQFGLNTVAFELPQHISLKISFQCNHVDKVLVDLESFLSTQSPFKVQILDIEQAGSILWLTVAESDILNRLHEELDSRMESRFGIAQHEFDKCFRFHSTLFLDADTKGIAQMHAALESYPFARTLHINTFLLGTSKTGDAGSYCVVRKIKV